MISSTGLGLNILISCDYILGHDWMSYLCWYSIKNNLSDAKVFVCSRRNNVSGHLFLWTKKFNVPFKMYNGDYKFENIFNLKSLLIIPPHVLVIRDFEESGIKPVLSKDPSLLEDTNFLKDSKSEDFCVFCSYLNGWGDFVTTEWIHNTVCPLLTFKDFSKKNMTMNEKRVEKIWNSSKTLFRGISGGR